MLKLRKYSIGWVPVMVIGAWLILQNAVATDEYSVVTRLEAWKIVLQLSGVSSLFGTGFANYYWYTPLVPINGWQVNFNSHSQYVDIFAQTGLVGLICYLWLFWEIFRISWPLRHTAPEGFEKAYVYGAIGGLAGTLVAGFLADWVLPFVYNIGMSGMRSSILSWLFLGGLIVIHKLVNQKKNSGHSNESLGGKNE
jgi:O-antigen ligase